MLDQSLLAPLLAAGWKSEGVAFCVPPAAQSSLKLDGVEEWLAGNKTRFDALARWIATCDQAKK